MLGLACATKWSGLYFIVFFGLMTLAFDIAARRQYRVPRPWLGAFRRDLGPSLYAIDNQNVPGCGAQSCVKAVMLVGTPAMWFIAVPVLAWAVWRAFVKRDWRYGAILVGYGAGYLPWFADIDRQMYFFYAATMAPFLVLAIAMILGDILHKPDQNSERRTLGLIVVCFYIALVITNFAWMYPILTGLPVSQSTWNMEIWLPSWR